jgi:MFS family permease
MERTYPGQRRNVFAFGGDTISFQIALSFININTILPAFVSQLGGSSASVGLMVTAFGLSWCLPQLIAGNVVARYSRKKPLVILLAFLGRVTMPAMAILIVATRANPPWLIQTMLYVALAVFLGSDAFATMGWLDMLGRAIPPEKRGHYISLWQAIAALGVTGASLLVRVILSEQGPPFPDNFAVIFALGSVALYASAISGATIWEPPLSDENPTSEHIDWSDFGRHLAQIFREDHRLCRAAVTRVLFSMGAMAFPFYVLYATDELHLPDETIGIFIFAQTAGALLGSLVLGRMADRYGPQRVIQIGSFVILSAPVLGLLLALGNSAMTDVLRHGYLWIYVCIGLANSLLFLGFSNYVLDIAPANQRTIYLGAFNTINSVGTLGTTLAGWLLGVTSYSVLFVVTLVFGVLTFLFALRLVPMRQGTPHSA